MKEKPDNLSIMFDLQDIVCWLPLEPVPFAFVTDTATTQEVIKPSASRT